MSLSHFDQAPGIGSGVVVSGGDVLFVHGASGAAVTIDTADGNIHDVTLNDDCVFSAEWSSDDLDEFTLVLRWDGAGHVPDLSFVDVWTNNNAGPSFTASDGDVEVVQVFTVDGGDVVIGQYDPDYNALDARMDSIEELHDTDFASILTSHSNHVIDQDAHVGLRAAATTTAGRPAAGDEGVGATYYDTDLDKPIWSDGTVWRDAAGNAV